MRAVENNTMQFVLKLFVSGASPNSLRAIHNVKTICEAHLKDRYTLENIDVRQEAGLVKKEQLVVLPMLIKELPLPEKKLIGDMSNKEKVLKGLGIEI